MEDKSIQDNDNTEGNQNSRYNVSDVIHDDIHVDLCQHVFNVRQSGLYTLIDIVFWRVDIGVWSWFLHNITRVPVKMDLISCKFSGLQF